jgi:hypothetical protein
MIQITATVKNYMIDPYFMGFAGNSLTYKFALFGLCAWLSFDVLIF